MLFVAVNGYNQNNAPIAVNDTFYVAHNDSLSIVQFSGSLLFSQPNSLNFLSNDSDPDGNLVFIDTAFYNGGGVFNITTDSFNVTALKSSIGYKPSLNYVGIDSIQYILRDNGTPIMYDTATIYLFVKRQEFQQLDLNNINARVDNIGLFRDAINGLAAFEVPKGSGSNTIFAANLWVAGKNQDSVYSNSETFNTQLTYGRSGPIMDSVYYDKNYSYEWDRLWKISNLDIIYHQNNWNSGGYQPIEVIASWPAHGDTSKGQAFYLAPFVDNNGDGIYNPYDGDSPKIKGQQAIYFIYNDMREQITNRPMNSEIHGMAYAYKCPSDSAIYNTIFLDYTIYNRSNLTYDSTYIGMWNDFDIGNYSDDAIACDVARSTFYAFNGDSVDENANGAQGIKTILQRKG